MAVIKCKMCGGDLNIEEGMSVAECEYCGTKQTVPNVDDEKKLKLFERANRLRAACEFDKASGVYESIVADFDTEAEAYWGLILCRYGIEYVDDPASGNKVPTCHRSSFESVLKDPNFELVMENSDAVSRQVYRNEAKVMEELRKSIVEVSSKEEPYDVFISYKELDAKGERTVDSVIAQDIYDRLTEKGYRVFFSRISLESKLGVEYEPYIFAALNSAKVMLVVGTEYDNFNAVWVKNEWSRYLALMAKDHSKMLIPCFKDIDAYDMPEEFNKLAAQDMGKVGAMQDLVRGVEKIVGKKQQEPTVVEKTTVVHSESDAKTTAAVKRGYMALEDNKSDDAKKYFDQALTLDAECAEAYWGLYLAGFERIDSTAKFLSTVKDKFSAINYEEDGEAIIACDEDCARVDAACEKYAVENYLAVPAIKKLYNFDRYYLSCVDELDTCRNGYVRLSDKNLERARKFASGEFKAELDSAVKELEADYTRKRAEFVAHDAAEKARITAEYEKHLEAADARVKQLFEEAEKTRTADYAEAKRLSEQGEYAVAKIIFERLTNYADSADKAQYCADTIKKQDEEKKRQYAYSAAMIAQNKAASKDEFIAAGKRFKELGEYKDSAARARACDEKVEQLKKAKKKKIITISSIAAAIVIALALFFAVIKPAMERNAQEKEWQAAYAQAQELESAGENAAAAIAYGKIGDYADAHERSIALWNDIAERTTYIEYSEDSGIWREVKVNSDGTVTPPGDDEFEYMAYWTDIISVSRGDGFFVGLRSSGKVVAVGENTFGQCNVSDWTDIVAVYIDDSATIGLKSDGTVVTTGYDYDKRLDTISGWTDIVAIYTEMQYTVGLKSDGTVVATGNNDYGQCDVSDWTDVVAVYTEYDHVVGLKSDGTVVAAGNNDDGQCNVLDWTDVVSIYIELFNTFGLKSDGTVVAAGSNENGQCNVSGWTDITAISINDRGDCIVGLKSDGTVVATGWNMHGQCDVSDWTDIVAVYESDFYTIGLKSDGTAVSTQKGDVSDWTDVVEIKDGYGIKSDGTRVEAKYVSEE